MGVSRLRGGDYRPDGTGGFQQAIGADALLERVLFQLSARRGSFPLMPQVGSRLYLLPGAKPSAREAMAASYAAEALAGWADLTVTGTAWDEAARQVTVYLDWQGEALRADVAL